MSQPVSESVTEVASPQDDWSSIIDPKVRRRMQNRIAQRKFRERLRLQKQELGRRAEDQRTASGAYAAPEAEDFDTGGETGLPWGSISMRHVVAAGQAKEQSSREASLHAAASKVGGSSSLGLHLADEYARGSPAWAAWSGGKVPFVRHGPGQQ